MAYGGGLYDLQNKKLPGVYYKLRTLSGAFSNTDEIGVVAAPLELDWGETNKVFEVTSDEFYRNSFKYFGYNPNASQLTFLRDLFKNAQKLIAYRLAGGAAATCKYGTAVCPGTRGNALRVNIAISENKYVIKILLDNTVVNSQTADLNATTDDLVANDFVVWAENVDLAEETVPLTGGSNTAASAQDYETALNNLISYSFNILTTDTTDRTVKKLFVDFTNLQRERYGKYFQCILSNYTADSDYEGVISVENSESGSDTKQDNQIVFWLAGAAASCPLDKSLANLKYDGESPVMASWGQAELENSQERGAFVFHRHAGAIVTFEDINTLKTFDDLKTQVYCFNEAVRLKDRLLTAISNRFTNFYLGHVKNDEKGRTSLWSDIVTIIKDYSDMGAVVDFKPNEDVIVQPGEKKEDVEARISLAVSFSMQRLYIPILIN